MEELDVVQHKDEIITVSEFDVPKVDILTKVGVFILHLQGFKVVNTVGVDRVGVVILHLQGFKVVNIVGVDPERAQIGNLDVHVSHTGLYTRIHVWLKSRDGIGG
jgi:hypothetical protein